MKTKNILNTVVVTTAILLGFQTRASQNVIDVRSEKYKCEIETNDGKNYLLDIGWSESSSEKYLTKTISFNLKDSNAQHVAAHYFTNTTAQETAELLSYNNVNIENDITSLKLSASNYKCLRPGCYTSTLKADFDVYRITTLSHFSFKMVGEGYYGDSNVELDIAFAKCEMDVNFED